MKTPNGTVAWLLAALLCQGAAAQGSPPAPAFDVAYRAWDVVTDIGRHNRNPDLGGECARTFRPFVIPGLRRQTNQEQDVAATACLAVAKAVCTDARWQRTAEMARKCEEFR
jgi:hypothetical protein